MSPLRLALALVLALAGCEGTIGGGGPSDSPPAPDAGGSDGFGPPPECGQAGEMIFYFETTCAGNGACHQPGGQFPDLTRTGLPDLVGLESEAMPGETLVVSADPESSWLYRKMAGLQGEDGGGVMPAGRRPDWDELPADVVAVADWIGEGAPATCDGLPPVVGPHDPNTLDRDALFTCADPTAPRASPARYRRIEKLELTHSVSRRLDGKDTAVIDNPLETPVQHEYATYAEGVTLDSATLGVLMLSLPGASTLWRKDGPSFSLPSIDCFYSEAEPSADCIDAFVQAMLRRGSLYRDPSDFERTHLRELVVRMLSEEEAFADRRSTAQLLHQAASLTSGAMFRAELPESAEATTMDGQSLAIALARLLSTHPPGSIKINAYDGVTADPDHGRLEEGWMAAIAQAAQIPRGEPGSIFDPETRRELVLRYAGGVDPSRGFWELDESALLAAGNPVGPGRIGEFWIASEFVRFFRQWLDYEDADSVFKDTPAATSPYEDADRITEGFNALQGGGSREGRLTHQLDDWIARLVVETHESGGRDFWRELMTGRQWHLPATGEGPPCDTVDDCTMTYASCTRLGDCRNTSGTVRRINAAAPLVFGVEALIPGTQAARWVTVPEAERMGVLTHPTWLAAHGGNFEHDPSIIERGKWIRERIFCQSVPPLTFVEVEAQLIAPSDELSARDRVAMSTENERCIACHGQMNSLGYPFELFNHAGFFRETDHGRPPDGSTVITNLPVAAGENLNGTYETPFELIAAIAESTQARRGFIRHAFRYFMGRGETMADACTLAEMEEAFGARGSFVDMVGALAASETFAQRAVDAEGEGS